jgi:hypothetical protein
VLVEFLIDLVAFLADGVPGVNNGRSRLSTAKKAALVGGRFFG